MSTSYAGSLSGGLLKTFYEPGIKEQFFNDKVLMKRLKKNRSDIQGGAAAVGLHTGRNPGVGVRGNGVGLPAMGQQSHSQATIPLRYMYGRTYVSGPDIANTRGDKGAFARILDTNMKGLMDDMQCDINRQLFSDGSGILAIGTTTETTGATGQTMVPYLWYPATKYLNVENLEVQTNILAGTALDPADSDTAGTALQTLNTTTDTLF